jgi:hypothetical protein
MSNALPYQINECRFDLPHPDVQDASINILKFAEPGTSLIVSRSLLEPSDTLRSSVDGQLKRLEQQVQELRCEPLFEVLVGAGQDIAALEFHSQFSKGADNVFQYQLAMLVPGTRQLLALSYVKASLLDETDALHWAAIKASLRMSAADGRG